MQCNLDEAVRAKDIANIKLAKEDFYGAKKFVLIAQKLSPSLDGLSQMLDVLEVHTVAESKLGGILMDWYGILQVDPGADTNTIRKQYLRLALILHPDKNAYVGAEAAFKLVGEGWCILSDKEKRAQHDEQRKIWGKAKGKDENGEEEKTPYNKEKQAQQDQQRESGEKARGKDENGEEEKTPYTKEKRAHNEKATDKFCTACPNCPMRYWYKREFEFNYTAKCSNCQVIYIIRDIHRIEAGNERHEKDKSRKNGETSSHKEKQVHNNTERDTFWAACDYCEKRYKYERKLENKVILCSNCQHNFITRDICRTSAGNKRYGEGESRKEGEAPPIRKMQANNDIGKDLFWTACPNCNKHYYYEGKPEFPYHIRCLNCQHSFMLQDIYGKGAGNKRHG